MSEILSHAQLIEKTSVALRTEWDRWVATLPPEAPYWPKAAVYIRESSPDSLVGDAPLLQLRNTLQMFASESRFVPWELVTLESATGTELAVRTQFRRLLDRAEAGEFNAIGALVSSRFFRNVEEAIMVKRRMAKAGVSLVTVGKPLIDPRDPSAYLLERNLEIADEWATRTTSYHVALSKERACEDGTPIGRLPEMWQVAERSLGRRIGRPGPPIRWELTEPLTGIVQEAALRYLAGHTFADLGRWSLTTELAGLTPAGRHMDRIWWQWNLVNPKLAGFQHRTDHPGYKPGKELAKRTPRGERELLPCKLPALITFEQHLRIKALAKQRHRGGARRRVGYQVEILSGVAYNAACGHKLHIKSHAVSHGNDFYLRCAGRGKDEAHSGHFRGRDAANDVERLFSAIQFDEALLARVDLELQQHAQVRLPARVMSPQELQLRAALNELNEELFPDLHRQMLARIDAINAAAALNQAPSPAATFRVAVSDLRRWPEIWASSTAEQKNGLLRAAGVRVYVESIARDGRRGGFNKPDQGACSRVVRIESDVPEFALALAAVTGALGASNGLEPLKQFDALPDFVRGDSQFDAQIPGSSSVIRVQGDHAMLLRLLRRWQNERIRDTNKAA